MMLSKYGNCARLLKIKNKLKIDTRWLQQTHIQRALLEWLLIN